MGVHMIVKTLGYAYSLKSISRNEGDQIKCAHAHIIFPPFKLFHLIFSPCLNQIVLKNYHAWATSILITCP
jgi:hypothetical protein